jgi:hypothetical protein
MNTEKLNLLGWELAVRGDNWKNNTFVATDKNTLGGYTDGVSLCHF